MTSGQQRQVRLRLARRRTASGRVRARVREESPEPQPEPLREPEPQDAQTSWWRRVPWVTIGAVATVLGGIGSVIFTGVATYYGAETAQDQLEQSRQEAARESRSHASLVTLWVEGYSGGHTLHIMNRSPDPVNEVVANFTLQASARDGSWGEVIVFKEWLRAIPPCTELIYNPSTMRYRKDGDEKVWGLADAWRIINNQRLAFTDRYGNKWVRLQSHLLSPAEAGPWEIDTGWLGAGPPPTAKKASHCGEGGKSS
ncbi:hypothetical protein [Streptomyces afghaniensis]|uniref:hypothetical protein n=1 Tax=Streptomyces afghaniensis TaxID=66865 RepID=UPI003791AF8E